MKRFVGIFFILISISLSSQQSAHCNKILNPDFIESEQEYNVHLKKNDEIRFYLTFYNKFQYRLVVCPEQDYKNVCFSVYDLENRLLFTNEQYDYSSYWDFIFNSTIECIVKVKIKDEKFDQGNIKLLLGYKRI